MNEALGAELAAAVSAVMSELASIPKDKENTMQGYAFTSETAIANTLRPLMSKHGLSLVPFNIEVSQSDQVHTKSSTLNRVLISASYRMIHKSGQFMTMTIPGEGMDSLDKSVQKALTAAYKYALIQCFCAGRGDDGDEGKGYEGGKVEATARPVATSPARAVPQSTQDDGGYVFEFGKYKGQSIRNADSDYLKWLLNDSQAQLNDPEKYKFKIKNKKMIDIILDEINRRARNAVASEEEATF